MKLYNVHVYTCIHVQVPGGGGTDILSWRGCAAVKSKMGAMERPIKEKEGLGNWPIKEKEGLGNWPIKEKRGLGNWILDGTKYETHVHILYGRPTMASRYARIQGHGRQRARRWAAQARGDARLLVLRLGLLRQPARSQSERKRERPCARAREPRYIGGFNTEHR